MRLSEEADGIFARNVSEFIVCTEEAAEADPAVVMRNVRQFVSGIKNYLVRNGERGRLTEVIDEERERVGAVAEYPRCTRVAQNVGICKALFVREVGNVRAPPNSP